MFVTDELLSHTAQLLSTPMPRRKQPDPLAFAIGQRIQVLRQEAGLTLEKLAYESGQSKGYISDIEHGLARPTVATLKKIADHLGVLLLDLVTFPDEDDRQRLTDTIRRVASKPEIKQYLGDLERR
jgi:transcriptional regulator with XRE-family HTH domain